MSDKTLVQHMAEIMKSSGYVQNDAAAPTVMGGFGFASAKAVFNKVRAELAERGICISGDSVLEHFSVDGKVSHAVVKSTITLHLGDETLTVSAHGEGKNAGGKAVMGANTAGNKYCVAKLLLMSWGDDPEFDNNDGDMATRAAAEHWLSVCETASNTTAEKFAPWWKTNGEQIKKDCGQQAAAGVHDAYATYLKRLRAEVAE